MRIRMNSLRSSLDESIEYAADIVRRISGANTNVVLRQSD